MMNIRKAVAAPFIRRVPESLDDHSERSHPVIGIGHSTYGTSGAKQVHPSGLASRTDADGNVEPYTADDAEVLSKFFGVEID